MRVFVHEVMRGAVIAALGATLAPMVLPAQPKAPDKGAPAPTLMGNWQGTASVPLKDSTITVPVLYTFTQTGSTIGGTAAVPGQGSGPISNVVVSGKKVTFRVTATPLPTKPVPGKPAPPAPTPKELEHDGAFTADGAIEGFVNLDKQPIAKFRIVAKPAAAKK
jgi:hypothetical protein